MHPTYIYVDVYTLRNNIIAIKKFIGNKTKICLPVKANAYGHGLIGVAKNTEDLVDYLAVSCLDEGKQLRDNLINIPILVFGAFDEEQIVELIENSLEVTISSLYKARLVVGVCEQLGKSCKIHLKIDTGMRRVGVRPESVSELIIFIQEHNCLKLTGIYSHFAASEDLSTELTANQILIFDKIVNDVKKIYPNIIAHIANSGGVYYHLNSHYDMVRPGLLSYGYFPSDKVTIKPLDVIRPCFKLTTRVVYFKVIPEQSGISYNHRYKTTQQSRIITIPIGYGDGFRRGLSNQVSALVNGKRYPIVGNICMDLSMIDLGADGEAYVGDEVVLIGSQGEAEIKIEELAIILNTIIYEILVGFNERIPRIYLNLKEKNVSTSL